MFSVEIREASKQLTKKEQIALKDTTNAIKLDEATKEAAVIFKPANYAVLAIHNDKSTNPDYVVYVVQDVDGNTYVTGSNSFFESFYNIFKDMEGETEEWELKVYRSPSKNYVGRDFLTCAIV